MENDESSRSFLTSLPGILTALGTLVAAAAALIALFLTHGGGKPSLSSSTGAGATVSSPTSSGAGTTIQNVVGGGPLGDVGNSSQSSTPVLRGPSDGATSTATPPPPPAPAISAVSFTGGGAAPTVIVSGRGFGTSAPAGMPDNTTSCGGYTNNGNDYGNDLWFIDNGNFAAGIGTPPNGSCIGITVQSWSSDQVTYQFGNAYNSFDHWYISAGDQYTLSVDGVPYSGTVSFSG